MLVNDFTRRGAGRHRRRRRRAGRAGRRPAASRTARWPCWARAPASARRSCSGRPPRTATRSSPRRAATSTWRARTPLEHGLVHFLTEKYGRVSCERVLSGKGLVDVFKFLSEEPACRALIRPETAAVLAARRQRSAPPRSPQRALAGTDPVCEMALALFCSVLGAVAGNLGLMVLATGGVFVAGGIAPRVLPLPAAGRLSRGVRSQGPPAHAGRAHARLTSSRTRNRACSAPPRSRRHNRS